MNGFLVCLALAAAALSGRTFHVASDGDDAADGLSPETAWRSLQKVNEADLLPADTVRFRCGDAFRGHLVVKSGEPGRDVVYSSYGTGEKPVLEASYDASSPNGWVRAGRRLWKCAVPAEREIGNVIFNHGKKGCGWKAEGFEDLGRRDLRFFWNAEERALYLVSRRNPGERFGSIELAEKVNVIRISKAHDVVVEGLNVRYGAAHGIAGGGIARIVLRKCDVNWIGGGTLCTNDLGGGVWYGNGIELWSYASDVLVEGCRVWECYDAGLTNQSNRKGTVQENIVWRGNEVSGCEYSYEYWNQGEGAVTRNVVFEGNVCRKAGYGWGHRRRWNPNAAHLMFYDNTAATSGFMLRGNVFSRSKGCGIRLFNVWREFFRMEDNVWSVPGRPFCRFHGRPYSGLDDLYPDHLDRSHCDNAAEIESCATVRPRTFRNYGQFEEFIANMDETGHELGLEGKILPTENPYHRADISR